MVEWDIIVSLSLSLIHRAQSLLLAFIVGHSFGVRESERIFILKRSGSHKKLSSYATVTCVHFTSFQRSLDMGKMTNLLNGRARTRDISYCSARAS